MLWPFLRSSRCFGTRLQFVANGDRVPALVRAGLAFDEGQGRRSRRRQGAEAVTLPLEAAIGAGHQCQKGRFFGDPEAAWFHLDELHGRGQAYNLVYGGDGLLVMERVRQGEQPNEPWSAGFAWSEVAGVFPVAGRAPFESLDHAGLARALLKLKTPAEP